MPESASVIVCSSGNVDPAPVLTVTVEVSPASADGRREFTDSTSTGAASSSSMMSSTSSEAFVYARSGIPSRYSSLLSVSTRLSAAVTVRVPVLCAECAVKVSEPEMT